MENSVTLLNFDGGYKSQSFYLNREYEWIDLEAIPNTNLFCERETLKHISGKMSKTNPRTIHYLGSGNHHYASYLLQSKIETPYSLILFDHHTDTLPSPSDDLISCGSWVLDALQTLPMLKKVFIIGVNEDAAEHVPESMFNKIVYYTKNSFQSNFRRITKSILKNIPTRSIYISIDKDVLDKKDAMTGWDHGTLRLKQLLNILKALFKKKKVIGIDVCGEIPMDPSNSYKKVGKEAIAKNNFANLILLEFVTHWTQRDDPSTIPLKV